MKLGPFVADLLDFQIQATKTVLKKRKDKHLHWLEAFVLYLDLVSESQLQITCLPREPGVLFFFLRGSEPSLGA